MAGHGIPPRRKFASRLDAAASCSKLMQEPRDLWDGLPLDRRVGEALTPVGHPPLTASRCRAARHLLGISIEALAMDADLHPRTVVNFENGTHCARLRTLRALRSALEAAGIEFMAANEDGPGVRLRKLSR